MDNQNYEKLKEAGLPEEQAIRFSDKEEKQNDAATAPAYEKWPKEKLYRRAKELNIAGIASMDKNLLIEALRHHSG